MTVVDQIFEVFASRGHGAYFGENVSQLEHALQAASLAERSGAAAPLIVAALLHDIGHLLHDFSENIADHGVDTLHETAGAAWLAAHFGPEVTEPIRLHVDAKRYLCATDSAYQAQLSAASIQSLELQGGPFTDSSARQFERLAYWREAVLLRRWDDLAKESGLATPPLEHFRGLLHSALRS